MFGNGKLSDAERERMRKQASNLSESARELRERQALRASKASAANTKAMKENKYYREKW
jgi:hypothetical protein